MPPKKAASKQKGQEEQREETLQAVVLTDSFQDRFAPFALERPRCLLPVANIPLIEYTLEFLANSGVKDVFLYSSSHEDQVEEYINTSRWMAPTSPITNLTILRCPASSAGDVMRDLDKRDLITGDFILVSGDVISNININSALALHRQRREKDKNAIMTMILREVGKDYHSKPSSRKPLFFIDPSQNRCLYYDELSSKDRGDRRFHLDDDLLTKPEIDIRGDVLDCFIDICTPDVLALWTDNPDNKSLRSSFLRGVLQDYELHGKTVHTHIFEEGYVSRVSSLRAYDAITQDIIHRWSFPFTPDSNLLPGHNYQLFKKKVYTESGVVLARGSSVTSNSIIGKDTSVGDRSVISNSVLGRRCQIGKNVKIDGSYIWDDVVIGDNSVITGAVIASEVVIGPDCDVSKVSLLSFRVRLSKGIKLPSKTRLTDTRNEFSTDKTRKPDISLVGSNGAGYAYEPDSDASEVSNALISTISRRKSTDSLNSMSTLHSDPDSDLDMQSGDFTSMPTSPGEETGGNETFLIEATTSIQDGILKGDDPDTVKLELMGQRLTYNVSDEDMRDAIAQALIKSVFTFIDPPAPSNDRILSTSPSLSMMGTAPAPLKPVSPATAVGKVFKTYSPLLVQMGLFDSTLDDKSDQVAVLGVIEKECANKTGDLGPNVLLFTLNELHRNLKILQDQGVQDWWDLGASYGDEVRSKALEYIEMVLGSDDEEEDSDEEDDDEEEDEDESD